MTEYESFRKSNLLYKDEISEDFFKSSDKCSVPKFFKKFYNPDDRAGWACVIHDWMCKKNRWNADIIFFINLCLLSSTKWYDKCMAFFTPLRYLGTLFKK